MSVCDWSKIIEKNKKIDKERENATKSLMASEIKSAIEEAEDEMEQ